MTKVEVVSLPEGYKPEPTTLFDERSHDPELYAQILETVTGGGYLDPGLARVLKSQGRRAQNDVWEIAQQKLANDPPGAAETAAVLAELGDPRGRRLLFELVGHEANEARIMALERMAWIWDRFRSGGFVLEPEEGDELIAALDDPVEEVRSAAVQACGVLEPAGIVEVFGRLLAEENPPDPGRLAFWLSRLGEPEKVLPVVTGYIAGATDLNETHWALKRLSEWAKTLPGEAAEECRRVVESVFAGELEGREHEGRMYGGHFDQQVVGPFAAVATADSLRALETIYRRAGDRTSRGYALIALARLRKQDALPLLEEVVGDPYMSRDVVRASREALTSESRDDVLQFLLSHVDSLHLPPVAELLLDEFGEEGRRAVIERLDRLRAGSLSRILWRLQGWTVREALDEAHRLGLLREAIEDHALDRLVSAYREEWGESAQVEGPTFLRHVLAELGVALWFDSESDVVPSPHDELIRDFARLAPDPLTPSHIRQEPNAGPPGEEMDLPTHRLELIVGERLYRFHAENYGDWYDVNAVHEAMNFVAEDLGLQGRYFSWPSDGQDAFALFGDASAVKEWARSYVLPLGLEPSTATEAGRDFERQVIERLKRHGL